MSDLDYDALRKVAEAAPREEPWPRKPIDQEGTCDSCGVTKYLIAAYLDPSGNNEPWVCDECDAESNYLMTFDPPTVLRLLDLAQRAEADRAAIERVRALAEQWRYKGEFGWGAWQEGHGPDPEGETLDHAAAQLRAALDREEDQ